MKKRILAIFMTLSLITPMAVWTQESPAPGKELYEKQKARWKENWLKQREENKIFLKNKLVNKTVLSDAQKDELIEYFQIQYRDNSSYREQRHAKNVAFFEETASDPNMTQDQRKAAIKEYFKNLRSGKKGRPNSQRIEKTDERDRHLVDTDNFTVVGTM